jgi:membrane complex biogenesis BtpA family protein
MSKVWTEEVLGTKKPIIAMCHLNPMPSDPNYDPVSGMKDVVAWARKDFLALQNGGVDAVMFSNEFSGPYMLEVEPVVLASMARIIGELLSDIKIPFGVDVQIDPYRTLDLAAATGAAFVRETFTGLYSSNYGMRSYNPGKIVRYRNNNNQARDVKMLYTLIPEGGAVIGDRTVEDIAMSIAFNQKPDALLVSGKGPGQHTSDELLTLTKKVVPDTLVFANTGVNVDTVEKKLSIADGAVVGTTFKVGGVFENHVDPERVKAFMAKVKKIR